MDFLSPSVPGTQPQPTAIDQFLANPRLSAALLQTGLSLMTPQWGSPIGQVAQAIGSGAEAAQRQEAEDIKQQEANSKEDLRNAQAGAAEARANTASVRSNAAADRLGLMREMEQNKNLRAQDHLALNYHQAYDRMVAARQKANENADLMGTPKMPIPTKEEFFAQAGVPHLLHPSVDAGEGGGSTFNRADPTSNPPGWYPTPTGNHYWDGKGWTR